MKFLNAAKFYEASVLILGGDITGKMITPIVLQSDGSYKTTFLGSDVVVEKEQLPDLEKKIRYNGFYPYRTEPNELDKLSNDPKRQDELFSDLMVQTVLRWIKIAEERLRDTGVKCYITPGNDDRVVIDQVFEKSEYVRNPEGKVVDIGGYEMISTGYSNRTPFDSPREVEEDVLQEKIESMASHVTNFDKCIFNFHCPPLDSGIDMAPKLDKDMRPILSPAGGFEMIPAGSKAVKEAISKYQPLLALHGHIHESSGMKRIGKTLCLNPGSQYSDGILRGALVTLKDGKVANYLLTRG
jgi:Icc-related predicted phosphoesterase